PCPYPTLFRSPSRGEVWSINFDPSVGAEIQKLGPALGVSLDAIGRLPLRIVAPITDWKPHYSSCPWMVALPADSHNHLSKDSGADVFQTKSLSLDRFGRRLGTVTPEQMDAVASATALCVGAP